MNWKSFIGVLTYFAMNLLLLWAFFAQGSSTLMYELVLLYALTIVVSLSPVGEWVLCVLAGAKPIPRKDMNVKLIPLVEVVLNKAKKEMPPMVSSVKIRFIDDPSPMAYALGRRTICVTEGLLRLSDEDIMGALSHEMGHLAYRHTTVHLLIGGGNILITGFVFLIKLALKIITFLSGISIFGQNSRVAGIIMTVFTTIVHILVSAWTKVSMAFLCWSKRENEFIADKFAYEIGFGNELASVLDKLHAPQNSTFIQTLFNEHPSVHERIGRLQNLGSTYFRY